MIFNKFSPQTLRFAIEKELQNMEMPNTKAASVIALNNLKEDPEYYMKKYGFFSPLEKARPTKYIRRIPKPGGGWKYIYKEENKKPSSQPEKPKDQTQTPEFKKWFGDSKVVDENGKPLVVYHGTGNDFKEFDKDKIGKSSDSGMWGSGFYFSDDPEYASSYAKGEKGNVKPVYLSIKNPMIIKSKENIPDINVPMDTIEDMKNADSNYSKLFTEYARKKGHDGIMVDMKGNKEIIAFSPNQIKSAIGNRGTFDMNSNDMTKARGPVKYYKKLPDGKGGWRYFYTKEEYQKSIKKEETPKDKSSWIGKLAGLFGFKDRREAMQKVERDYKDNQIAEKYQLTWDGWKDHLSEYFNHKDKWDAFFNKSKAEKKDKKADKTEKKEKKEKKDKKPAVVKLSVMKLIHGLYGEVKPEVKAETPEPVEANKVEEDNFDTMPEVEVVTDRAERQKIINSLKEVDLTKRTGRFNGRKITEAEMDTINKQIELYRKKLGLSPEDKIPTGFENNEKEKKQYDKKVSKAINTATEENRFEKEREIMGVEKVSENIETPAVEFVPGVVEIDTPLAKNTDKITAQDFSGVPAKDIYLMKPKNILNEEKPAYISDVNKNFFSGSGYLIPAYKISENKYLIKTDEQVIYMREGKEVPEGEDKYAVVSRDVLAATQHYYFNREKELLKKKYDELDIKYGRKVRRSRLSIIKDNKMSGNQVELFSLFNGYTRNSFVDSQEKRKQMWKDYKEIRQDIKQKSEDLEIQFEEYENSHTKGRETSYGDSGLKDNLYNDYGIMVKRQNGEEITDEEINEIKSAITDVFSAFGDRSSMSKNFGLKISHSGDVLMHARKAAGLFIPSMKAIGVSAKYGQEGTGFILAHEFGHFMDFYIGNKEQRHYASDDPSSLAGKIAEEFRSSMEKEQKSKYMNRTCECFARAMEQYWATKTDNKGILEQWNTTGTHPTQDIFEEKIMPKIDQFFEINKEMLKAFFRKFNNKTKKFEYRRK